MNAALQWVDSPAWNIVGWSLLHYLWIGAVLGAAAWLFRRAVRSLSPQARYATAVATFAALAVAPPCIAWRVATHRGGESAPAVAPLSVATQPPSPLDGAAQAHVVPAPKLPASALPPLPPAAPPVETIEAFLARHGTNLLSIAVRWAPAVWLVGMPLTFAFLVTGLFGAERLRRRSALLTAGPIAEAARRWGEALRISRAVAVGVSDRVVAPLVIGIVRPMIVLPAAIVARQSPEQMEMILLHELSHVRRADNLVNLIQRAIEAVFFFQPAVWFVSRWVRLEREHCCDNVVLSYTGDPQGYAETLASLAMPGISPAYAAAAMANHQLVSRIQHILSREEQTMSLSPKMVAIAGAICLVIGLSLSGAAQQTSPEAERTSAAEDATPAKPSDPAANTADAPSGRAQAIDGLVEDAMHYTGEYVAAADEGLKATANAASTDAASTGLTVGTDATVGVTLGQNSDSGIVGVTGDLYVAQEMMTGNKRPWGPEQATGAPDVPQAGDDARAWAALTQDDQDEWLELTYAEPVEVVAVQVFANYCAGAVSRVTVFDAHTAGLQYAWEGKDPVKTSGPYSRGVSIVAIPASIRTNRVRIELASKSVPGWNEIDAVGLLDANGKTHWATGATASSTYAERPTSAYVAENRQIALYRNALAQAQLAQETAALTRTLEHSLRHKPRALDGRDWSPDQATGAPADLSVADVNDRTHAWRPAEPDAGRETLRIVYNEPVKAKLLLVYELGEPGVVDIVIRDARQTELRVLSERNPKSETAGVLSLPLDGKLAVSSVILGIDTAAKPGWTDIDAVGLIDDQGQVHWGDWAQATSTRADVADRKTKANRLDAKWRQLHRHKTSNASCASCHKEDAATGSADNRRPARMRVGDLLEMSDFELRDWLNQHGAANIHIDEDGGATVQSGAVNLFFDAIQKRPKQPGSDDKHPYESRNADPTAPPANRGSQGHPRKSQGSDPINGNGDALVADASKSVAEAALDALDPKRVRANRAHSADVANRIGAYERAFDAQVAAARRQDDPKADKNELDGHRRLEDWLAAANAVAAAEQVQIALAAGERGHFSLPDRTIVCAERVELPDAKNVLSITITNDGALEFVGSEPGAGRLRCRDQNGRTIDVAITVKARPLAADPRAEQKPPPKPDPRDASNADAAMAIDRLVLDLLDKGVAPGTANPDPQTVARRADLHSLGVPPTAGQIEEFVGDGSQETLPRSLRKLADEAAATDAKEPPTAPRP